MTGSTHFAGFIDRRFYRARYDVERILALFASTARDEVDLEQLSVALLGVVEQTIQPGIASLLLKKVRFGGGTGGIDA